MRKFYNIENGEIITIEELQKEYFSNSSNWEYSFNEYLNNCTSKNGSLEEIKPLSDYEKKQVKECADDLNNAVKAFAFAMRNISEDSFNENLSPDYPFAFSFDELPYMLESWLDSVKYALDENKLEKH